MKVENMVSNARTAFRERKEIIDKLNECINSINTCEPEKIKDLESKNVQQDSDIASLKSASHLQMDTITAHETKISNIETKNAKQDDDINNLKNADTNNVKINKINEYAVGLTGNQDISGEKSFINNIIRKINIPGGSSPENYSANLYDWYILGNDGKIIISCGYEKSTSNVTRLVFSLFANTDIETNRQPYSQIHYIYDETNKKLTLRPAHVDKNGNRTFGTEQVLMTW